MNRRAVMTALATCIAGIGGAWSGTAQTLRLAVQHAEDHPLWPLWQAWLSAHVDFSGRVIDGPQGGVSHSEGQGYGMILAAELGDRSAFARMADWTQANLAIRSDSLLAWRWQPDMPERVSDINNASDGDLFHSWALLRAAERFDVPDWHARGSSIAADLARLCLVPRPDRPDTLLLSPAAAGFTKPDRIVVNPSYMMPLAMREVATATGIDDLARAAEAGLDLMAEIATTRLVPDWVGIDASGPGPAPGFSFNAGYEALRVPLFLAWSGATAHPALRRHVGAMNREIGSEAATVIDGATGAVLSTSPDAGYRAVAALSHCVSAGAAGAAIPPFSAAQPYYPATLHLFTLLAQIRRYPSCLPL